MSDSSMRSPRPGWCPGPREENLFDPPAGEGRAGAATRATADVSSRRARWTDLALGGPRCSPKPPRLPRDTEIAGRSPSCAGWPTRWVDRPGELRSHRPPGYPTITAVRCSPPAAAQSPAGGLGGPLTIAWPDVPDRPRRLASGSTWASSPGTCPSRRACAGRTCAPPGRRGIAARSRLRRTWQVGVMVALPGHEGTWNRSRLRPATGEAGRSLGDRAVTGRVSKMAKNVVVVGTPVG